MDGITIRLEDDAGPEFRKNCQCRRIFSVLIEFETASILLLPSLVQVNQHIDLPEEPESLIVMEVCVRLQHTSTAAAVETATLEIGVCQKSLQAGNLLQKLQKGRRVEILE